MNVEVEETYGVTTVRSWLRPRLVGLVGLNFRDNFTRRIRKSTNEMVLNIAIAQAKPEKHCDYLVRTSAEWYGVQYEYNQRAIAPRNYSLVDRVTRSNVLTTPQLLANNIYYDGYQASSLSFASHICRSSKVP